MRISDRYIGRQVLFGTLFAVLVLSLVLVLGNLFKQIRPLLVDGQAPLWLVLRFMFNALLVSLMFSVPWGFLSAVLLTFGRMSSAQEITGFRVAGVSLTRLVLPVIVLAAAFSGLGLWLNIQVVPRAKASVQEVVYNQVKRDPRALLSPGISNANFKNVKIFIEGQEGDSLVGLHLYKVDPKAEANPDNVDGIRPKAAIHAGKFVLVANDDVNKELRLKLYQADILVRREKDKDKKKKVPEGTAAADPPDDKAPPEIVTEMFYSAEVEPYKLPYGDVLFEKTKSSAMTNAQIREFLAKRTDLTEQQRIPYQVEMIQRYSFSMACLAFAFVGIPLGMQSRRKESSRGLLMSLVVAGAYFLFSVLADQSGSVAKATAVLWAPNAACVLLGLWLFTRTKFK